ncbi:MAG: amino acid transporter [Acidobacteria bacterium RIFCSPLOWO2_12_FULL_67_14]|nr:MAG: amino acid transporter [Acidobacteria bacterium RIFCSPLOWO2_02_FULL_67_21]OFW37075.1 MAG: amino acid transporter [Acidobacteria bacterium RIFCSPLOWO2_12_FULL_67_14]
MKWVYAGAVSDTFFGHPRGLATLFFTEMWERFSYYGMRALLILFMTAAPAVGGLGYDATTAGAVYGLYTFGVYALALPGGWIADRLLGQRRAVLYGGVLIALGHYSLAVPSVTTFYAGLLLIVFGTGLLKPNISAIVGDLYVEKDATRDAGFSIFYMGINLGALFGPLVCSWLGEPREGAAWVNWHYGFAAAGVGMTFALVQYVAGQRHLNGAGELKEDSGQPHRLAAARRQFLTGIAAGGALVALIAFLSVSGALPVTAFAESVFYVVSALFVSYFAVVIFWVARNDVERSRLTVCFLLSLGAAMFWSGFEQAGSALNLFARDLTDRTIFGTELTAGALQAINPVFIILLAPVVGMTWVKLGSRNPSMATKFGLGLLLLASGFLVMAWASMSLAAGRVGMQWLVATYFFHTVGELCLSPVGLSSMTKLAPGRLVGQMMGTWFMGAAIGNLVAGLVTRFLPPTETVEAAMQNGVPLFGSVAALTGVAGLLFIVFARPIRRMQAGVN